jgi:hypothetical protein
MKAEELADKLNSLCVAEFAWPYLTAAATELRRLAALEQAITDPENQPSQYGTITLEEHEKKVSAITEKYSDAVDRFVKEREKVFALEHAAEPVAWRWGVPKLKGYEWRYTRTKTKSDAIPLYTHPARKPMTLEQASNLMRELNEQHCKGSRCWGWIDVIRAVERFHQIKE